MRRGLDRSELLQPEDAHGDIVKKLQIGARRSRKRSEFEVAYPAARIHEYGRDVVTPEAIRTFVDPEIEEWEALCEASVSQEDQQWVMS